MIIAVQVLMSWQKQKQKNPKWTHAWDYTIDLLWIHITYFTIFWKSNWMAWFTFAFHLNWMNECEERRHDLNSNKWKGKKHKQELILTRGTFDLFHASSIRAIPQAVRFISVTSLFQIEWITAIVLEIVTRPTFQSGG